jgi:hypothetical protein
MGLAADIRKKIEKKTQQLYELEANKGMLEMEIRETMAVIQAYQEILKITPADVDGADKGEPNLRAGSLPALARAALQKHGSALHVTKLLEAMGKTPTQDNRISLSSSLVTYAKDKKIFTKPEANTFGLREWSVAPENADDLATDQTVVDDAVDRVAKASK